MSISHLMTAVSLIGHYWFQANEKQTLRLVLSVGVIIAGQLNLVVLWLKVSISGGKFVCLSSTIA